MTEGVPVKSAEELERWYVRSSYQDFVASEGAPLYKGSALEDLNALELADWKRRGGHRQQLGTFTSLVSDEELKEMRNADWRPVSNR